ncbi:HAUS1 protein, partial [Nyctibius bracteatus]|nr:HAUS1 protein [Nyctibius bracteatus]
QVTLWLEKIFGDQPIPEYEVNPRTVDILYELVEYNEARDREVSLMIEDMKQAAAEYEAKANYLQDILTEGLGLSPSSLSSEGTRSLDVLVNSAMILETKDTSLASLFAAINDMNSELYATESKNGEMELELSKIGKKLTAALMLEERLKEDLKNTEELLEVEEAEADRQTQNVKFLKDKSEDLKIRIKAAEEQLLATGLNQSLTHDSLMNLSE